MAGNLFNPTMSHYTKLSSYSSCYIKSAVEFHGFRGGVGQLVGRTDIINELNSSYHMEASKIQGLNHHACFLKLLKLLAHPLRSK